MQGPTHVLVGVLIERTFNGVRQNWLRVPLIAVTALFMHSVFDRIARLTYHPPEADFHSVFWISYHFVVLIAFIFSLYYFWKPYKLGIIFSVLPDFDWVIIHGKRIMGIDSDFYNQPWMHKSIHFLTDRIPPFSWLQHLPELTPFHWAALVEVLIVFSLFSLILYSPFSGNELEEEAELEDI